MKHIAILGSTGSIGQGALDVIRHFPGRFKVAALSTNSNIDILFRQIKEFTPQYVCVKDKKKAQELKARLNSATKIFSQEEGLGEIIQNKRINQILLAISGSAALLPLLKSIENKKEVALANKEALVMAGPIIMKMACEKKISIIPIDSEQSAIWQCLQGRDTKTLKSIYLTASGGPFRQTPSRCFKKISVSSVLKHPRWKMGRKVTVDSATLMNKGLELLEAMYLFKVGPDKIRVVIHPEAIIHSMVEFVDGVILGQLSVTDMRIPIQYALSYPDRLRGILSGIDFTKLRKLSFQTPNFKKFPCLELAYKVADTGGTCPCVLNAADEVAVAEFLRRKLSFISISKVIEKVLARHRNKMNPSLSDIMQADAWAREEAYRVISKLN